MDKYSRVRTIGKGSFGEAVLMKNNQENGALYVVKIITVKPSERKAAIKEAKLLSVLEHPNIIGYKESFALQRNKICIVTDYADSGDLGQKIAQQKKLGQYLREDEILDFFVQICLALKYVHDRKILHRDIKAQNIFLTKSNVVKLGDFGIAKVLNHTMECAASQIGTPYYLSPEICKEKKYNHKSDIWSLGCVLYELTTLKHAFDGRSMKLLLNRIVNGSYDPISSRFSTGLSALISEMLSKNPRSRPSINAILRRSIIKDRVKSFLCESAFREEFSHTVLHGHHILRPSVSERKNPSVSPLPKQGFQVHAVVPPPAPMFSDKQKSPVESKVSNQKRHAAKLANPKRVAPGVEMARKRIQQRQLQEEKERKEREEKIRMRKERQRKQQIVAENARMEARKNVERKLLDERKKRAKLLAARKKKEIDQAAAALFVKKKREAERVKNNVSQISGKNIDRIHRVSVFNAQWNEQKKHLMQNLDVDKKIRAPPTDDVGVSDTNPPVLIINTSNDDNDKGELEKPKKGTHNLFSLNVEAKKQELLTKYKNEEIEDRRNLIKRYPKPVVLLSNSPRNQRSYKNISIKGMNSDEKKRRREEIRRKMKQDMQIHRKQFEQLKYRNLDSMKESSPHQKVETDIDVAENDNEIEFRGGDDEVKSDEEILPPPPYQEIDLTNGKHDKVDKIHHVADALSRSDEADDQNVEYHRMLLNLKSVMDENEQNGDKSDTNSESESSDDTISDSEDDESAADDSGMKCQSEDEKLAVISNKRVKDPNAVASNDAHNFLKKMNEDHFIEALRLIMSYQDEFSYDSKDKLQMILKSDFSEENIDFLAQLRNIYKKLEVDK